MDSVCGVVRLAELHDVDAVRTEGGTDGRRWRRGAGLQRTLTSAAIFFLGGISVLVSFVVLVVVVCAVNRDRGGQRAAVSAQTFWIWGKVSSTGVSRPRISTRALSRWLFALISVIVAWSLRTVRRPP